MASQIPNLGSDFKEQLKNATEQSIEMLRSKCLDGKIFRSELELEVLSIFRQFGLEPEQSDYDNIEIALDSFDCTVQERYMTFDKFLLICEGTWELPNTLEKAKMLKKIVNRLKDDPTYYLELSGHDNRTTDESLYDCFGDDGLFDIIGQMQEDGTYTNEKALKVIQDAVKGYLNAYKQDPSDYKNILKPEAEEILKNL